MVTKAESRRVVSLVKRIGIVEASKRLGLHHGSVARIIEGQRVTRHTAARARERLAALQTEGEVR